MIPVFLPVMTGLTFFWKFSKSSLQVYLYSKKSKNKYNLQMSSKYTAELVLPVLDCFEDSDSRVRYYACESLYNVIKVSREASLVHFAMLFDTLSKVGFCFYVFFYNAY